MSGGRAPPPCADVRTLRRAAAAVMHSTARTREPGNALRLVTGRMIRPAHAIVKTLTLKRVNHMNGSASRMPVAFVPHGGGPWPFVEMGLPPAEVTALKTYLQSVRQLPARAPRALLVVSAHWEEPLPTLMTAERPPMLYDYYGFPPESYQLTWPAPG